MDQFNSIFEYLPAHRIVVCKQHHQGILKTQLHTHLSTSHNELTAKTRRDVCLAAAAAHCEWASTKGEIQIIRGQIQPIPHLEVYKNGFMCTACTFIRRTKQDIQAHCREEHGWANSKKRGRPCKGQQPGAGRMWREGVWCQKFQPTGLLGELFEVSPPEGEDGQQHPGSEERATQRAIDASMDEAIAGIAAAERKKQMQIEADTNRFEANAWLNRAGWARHLKGLDREWLATLVRKPERREKALRRVCEAVEMVIWRAQQASRPGVVGMAAMNYINRREMGSHTNEKPFNARQTEKTMIKYSEQWLRIVRYIWRTRTMAPAEPSEDESVVDDKRPPYRLTTRQDMVLQKMQQVVGQDEEDNWFDAFDAHESDREETAWSDEGQEKVEELALRFMLALLDHFVGDNEYTSALVSGMAVLGIDTECGWMSPLTYTPKQAAVVNVSRMLVLLQSTQERRAHVAQLREEGWGPKDALEMAHSHYYFVREMADRFMTLTRYSGEPTPIDAIQRLKAYGMKIRFTTNAEGVVDWTGDTLLYGNIRFSMPQMRSMIHGLVASTRQYLMRELMLLQVDAEGSIVPGTTPLPVICWDYLVDNPAERRTGWSFMEDTRNQGAIKGVEDPKRWLGKRVGQEHRLRAAFIDMPATQAVIAANRSAVWNKERVVAYRQAMATIRRDLAVLMHMTGGAPPRGSELVTVQYKNSANGESRGVFIEDGLVVYVTMYHKNIGSTGKSKVIHRYLPREVGELVVYYLWFALPFWANIEHAASGIPVETSAFIWEPEREKAWAKPWHKRMRLEASPQGSPRSQEAGGEEEMNSEEEVGEEGREKCAEYRMEVWNGNRVKNAIQRASLEYMGVGLNIMAWRHGAKAIYRRYISSKTAVRAVIQADEDDSESEDAPFDLGFGHTSHVGGMIYGRPITEAIFSTEDKRAGLRHASLEWHAFIQFSSTLEAMPKRGTRARAVREEAREEERRRWRILKQVDMDAELVRLVGTQARFRSVQKPALEAIMQHHSPVVAIMGTGAGKSILFMLPASVSSGVSIVVTPLVSLQEDMHDRCSKLGITCVEWSSRRPHEWAQVVLVTPESAVGEGFSQFINRQQAMGRLDRIVVDECHVVLDSLQGWRSRMMALRRLVTVETQMVYLTATLRPSEEALFRQSMGLPAKEQCQWFRGATTRTNVQYRIHPYDIDEEEKAVKGLVEELRQKYPLPGQVIVYCGTVAQTERLAEVLGCVCYHRNVGSSQEKRELVLQLTRGQQQVFTATNALGLGINAPTVRAVVHVGWIRLIRHYAQESGRAGRDGLPSEAIIMQGFKMARSGPVPQRFGKDVEAEMRELISGDGCMRKVIDKAMDGREDRVGCEKGEEKCQRCKGLVGGMESSGEEEMAATPATEACEYIEFERQSLVRRMHAVREAQQQSEEIIWVGRLVELMDDWKAGCQRCRAWEVAAGSHSIRECRRKGSEEIRQGVEVFKSKRRWAAYSCCFDCGLPQSVCQSFKVDIAKGGYYKQRGEGCQYAGVLVEAVMAIWVRYTQEFGDLVEELMIEDGWIARTREQQDVGPGMEEICRWFGEKRQLGGIESNKMCWFICKLVDKLEL